MKNKELRTVAQVIDSQHKVVGNTFDISSPMPGNRIRQLSPFLLIDHFGPTVLEPTEETLGGEPHPHRGFETVTLVYEGMLDHRDTGGHAGSLSPLDVQWMTAGSGVLHEEKFGRALTKKGGKIELIQLWINLPQKFKMVAPRYQELKKDLIPIVLEQNGNAIIRVIAGSYGDMKGPASTFSPIELWDLALKKNTKMQIKIPKHYNLGIYVIKGNVHVNHHNAITNQLVNFGWNADLVDIMAEENSLLLILAGEPIEEPLATYGPFAMNTNEELVQALADYETGKFGSF